MRDEALNDRKLSDSCRSHKCARNGRYSRTECMGVCRRERLVKQLIGAETELAEQYKILLTQLPGNISSNSHYGQAYDQPRTGWIAPFHQSLCVWWVPSRYLPSRYAQSLRYPVPS
jgi:hypothetical protein